jgi:hypothetical protein
MRTRSLRAIALVIVLTVAAACSGGSKSTGTGHQGSDSSDAFGTALGNSSDPGDLGPKKPVRFVILTPPGSDALDLAAGYDGTGQKIATGLKSGTVTDYLMIGSGVALVDKSGKAVAHLGSSATDGQRTTFVVGQDQDGAYTVDTLYEQDGHVLDGAEPRSDGGKAMIISDGFGMGPIAAKTDSSVRLGTAARHCIASDKDNSDGSSSSDPNEGGFGLAPATSPLAYHIDPQPTDLVWLTDVDCRTVETQPVHVDLKGGQYAYLFPYFASPDHLHSLLVPVTANGKGNDGVVDSGDGPTFSPTNHDTVVDQVPSSSTDEASTSTGDASSTADDTATDDLSS